MNAKYQTAIILMIALFALGEGIILAQQDETPILKPKAKPVTAATLLVMCDLACNWTLDGETKGRIDAGGSAKAKVELGQHEMVAVTPDGMDKVEQDIKITVPGQTIFHFALQPIRDARLQAERDADPVNLRDHAAERAKEGQALFDQHNFEEAKPTLEKACKGGEMAGCVTLGVLWEQTSVPIYDDGSLANKNEDMARGLYKKACDSGVMLGCTRLGLLLEFPPYNVWSKDVNQANSLFLQACDGGDMWGCNNLATSYESGDGVLKDHSRAIALYQKACLGGFIGACDNLHKLQ